MKIALCTDLSQFNENKIFNKEWAAGFPGASWVPIFAEMARKNGWEIVTGDVALTKVQSGEWQAKDIKIIQDLNGLAQPTTYGAWG